MLGLQTIKGIVDVAFAIVIVVLVVILIYNLIQLGICIWNLHKWNQALKDRDTMPIDEWEAKWSEFVNKYYEKLNDPNHDEVEADMKFFKEIREQLDKEDNNEND